MLHRSSTVCALLTTAVVAFAAPARAQATDTAVVVQVLGSVRGAVAPSTTWDDVKPGMRVKAGDTLKTTPGAAAELVFGSGAHVSLGENTIVRLQDLEGLGGRVLTGRVRVVAPPEGQASLIAGSLRLAGTDAEAVVEKAGSAWRVAVLSGAFKVAEAGRAPVTVDAGRSAIFATGGEPRYSVISRGASQDLLAGFAPDANAPQAATPAARGGNAPDRWVAATLSTLVPGTGQLYAGEVPRGLLYMGAEFALLGAGAYGVFNGQKQMAMYAAGGLLGLNLISPLDAVFTTASGGSGGSSTAARPDQHDGEPGARSTSALR